MFWSPRSGSGGSIVNENPCSAVWVKFTSHRMVDGGSIVLEMPMGRPGFDFRSDWFPLGIQWPRYSLIFWQE